MIVHSKADLERLISDEKTIGNFVFDEGEKRFFCDVEIVLVLEHLGEQQYRSSCYFFDGYEVGLDEADVLLFQGDEDEVKAAAIAPYPQASFMGYPILFTNISVEITPINEP